MSALLSRFGGWIAGAFSFVAMLVTVWFTAKNVGKSKASAEAANERANDREAVAVRQINETREAANAEIKTVKETNDVQADNSRLSDDDVSKRLRERWTR